MDVYAEIDKIRGIRNRDKSLSWGLVPTMGFLHEGHISLIRKAREQNERVGVSIFVNPIQFNDSTDLANYPQDLNRDLELLDKEKVDLVWTPTSEMMYPEDFQTIINVTKLTKFLEGKKRPGHFEGVMTIVAKLFNVFKPDRAYFGQKDAQQLAVIQQMVSDLNYDIDIIACPVIREENGLAMSSRNSRLSDRGREEASAIYKSLSKARELIIKGERDAEKIKKSMGKIIGKVTNERIDYISIANSATLQELEKVSGSVLISLAVYVENIRLIDNLKIEVS